MTGPQRQVARPSWPARAGLLALLVASLISWSLAPAAGAQDHIYWAWGTSPNPFDPAPSGVGRANGDGSGVDQSFITFHGNPIAIAVHGTYVYWLNTNLYDSTIGRAKLDGTAVEPRFIGGLGPLAADLAVDDAHVYWAHRGGIGRANLDGTGVDSGFIDALAGTYTTGFTGVAVSAANIYWAYQETGLYGRVRSLGCANIDGSGANYALFTANGLDVALDAAHVYWTTLVGVGRANLDGTAAQEGFIPASGDTGVALDAAHVYWTNTAGGSGNIGRANLDGTGVNQTFIADIAGIAGMGPPGIWAHDVAVDGPPLGSPGPSSCPPPPPPPDNSFSFGKLKRNLKKGTAKLSVRVPGPGELGLAKTKRLRSDSKQATAAGKLRLRVRPRRETKSKLADRGKVKVRLKVTYTPTGGEPNIKSKRVMLKRRRR